MRQPLIRNVLPQSIGTALWGDRERWGLEIRYDDACWQAWQVAYTAFYAANQRAGIGTIVNDAGYRVMREVDLSGKTVLEIGPGDIRHVSSWLGKPAEYILADVHGEMLVKGVEKLRASGIASRALLLERGNALPLGERVVDVVVSFYSLEHIYPLRPYLSEISRVLRPGGLLVGAIPAEGGLAWGAGRFFTSRRWFKKHTEIDPDKIICWEHPNFADTILADLDATFVRKRVSWWPLRSIPSLDLNLIIRLIYRKRS